jgi:hypothetical protein
MLCHSRLWVNRLVAVATAYPNAYQTTAIVDGVSGVVITELIECMRFLSGDKFLRTTFGGLRT